MINGTHFVSLNNNKSTQNIKLHYFNTELIALVITDTDNKQYNNQIAQIFCNICFYTNCLFNYS